MESQIALEPDPSQSQAADLTDQWQDFKSEKARWEESRQRAEAELEARRQVLDRQVTELEAQEVRLEQRQAALSERETALAAVAGFTGETQPVSVDLNSADQQAAEALAKAPAAYFSSSPDGKAVGGQLAIEQLQSGAKLETSYDANSADKADNDGPPQHLLIKPSGEPVPQASVGDHEESIDDYMTRLLGRIRGASGPSEGHSEITVERRSTTTRQPTPASPPTERVSPAHADVEPPPADADGPLQLVARTAPPELAANLQAMRELANLTARGAIDKHAQGRWSKAAVIKAILGAASLVCGLWLLFRATPLGAFGHALGLVVLAAGGFWSYQVVSLFRSIREVGRRTTRFVEAESHPATHESVPTPELVDEVAVEAATSDS